MVSTRHDGRMHMVEVTCSTAVMAAEVHRMLEEAGYAVTNESCELRDAFCRVVAEHTAGGPGFFTRRQLLGRLQEMAGGY
ncbi:MAG: hypothetical protein VR70_05570 [Rhodospirillaceae bacterium BRH_c57]|nr:MAG: hypothetical protein VR70_05570 [Rhodospirillaceae bacterium BRH_c57]